MDKKEKNKNEIITGKVIDLLSKEPFSNIIEILANVFVRIGITHTDINVEKLNHKTIYEHLLIDVKANGDTLGNALVRQGLIILDWLNKGEEHDRNT